MKNTTSPCDPTSLKGVTHDEELVYPEERPARGAPAPDSVRFKVEPTVERQTILGLGFEIQSDSIASGNAGLPEATTSVPHDLIPSERERLATKMLSGFRYCRIAGGLYWRGLTNDKRNLAPRWDGQLQELRALLDAAGVEGTSLEYWSPPPYWKANRRYEGSPSGTEKDTNNRLRCFGEGFAEDEEYHGDRARFLVDFGEACETDIATLEDAGISVRMWALNNEPNANTPYSSCYYEPEEWAEAFAAVAPLIRARHPRTAIIGDCADYTARYLERLQQLYPATAELLDYHVLHTIGFASHTVWPVVDSVRRKLSVERPIFQNEYEYLKGATSPDRCLNIVNNILNWFQLTGAPAWFWIHALKPVMNAEASGYSLGFWMPASGISDEERDALPDELEDLSPGHWTFNPHNWHALAGFLRYLPWESVVLQVEESTMDKDLRVLAFRRPDSKHVVVVSNHTGKSVSVHVEPGVSGAPFDGFRYTPAEAGDDWRGVIIGTRSGGSWQTDLKDRSWEFWVQK